jgi:hypothetical protein
VLAQEGAVAVRLGNKVFSCSASIARKRAKLATSRCQVRLDFLFNQANDRIRKLAQPCCFREITGADGKTGRAGKNRRENSADKGNAVNNPSVADFGNLWPICCVNGKTPAIRGHRRHEEPRIQQIHESGDEFFGGAASRALTNASTTSFY